VSAAAVKSRRSGEDRDGACTVVQAVVALLIGLGFAWLAAGFVGGLYAALDASPRTFRLSAGVLLAAVALGPKLPRWLAMRALRFSQAAGAVQPVHGGASTGWARDRHVWWMLVAVLGSITGIVALLLPALLQWTLKGHGALREGFLWSSRGVVLLDIAVVVVASIPFVMVGLFMQCAHRLGGRARRWTPSASVWLACGAGLGLIVAGALGAVDARGLLWLRCGGVPLLFAALVVAWRAPGRSAGGDQAGGAVQPEEPSSSATGAAILRWTLRVIAAATVSAGLIWVYVADALDMAAPGHRPVVGGGLLIAAAVGLAVGLRRCDAGAFALGAYGLACALVGAGMAVGLAIFNLVTRSTHAQFTNGPGGWLLWAVCAAVPIAFAGGVFGMGLGVVSTRAEHHPRVGAELLQSLFAAASLAGLVVALGLLEFLGSYAALVALALALVATGGLLVIHQPCRRRLAQRARLAVVFGGVVVLTFLMPDAGRQWLGNQQPLRGSLWESWGVTQTLDPPRTSRWHDSGATAFASAGEMIDWYRVGPRWRVGCVSLFGAADDWASVPFEGRVVCWPLLPSDRVRATDAGAQTALSALRGRRDRFDLLVLALGDAPVDFARHLLTYNTVDLCAARLSADGKLICILPRDATVLVAARQRLAALAARHPGASLHRGEGWIANRPATVLMLALSAEGGGQLREIARLTLAEINPSGRSNTPDRSPADAVATADAP
jgi:hypothetical protein